MSREDEDEDEGEDEDEEEIVPTTSLAKNDVQDGNVINPPTTSAGWTGATGPVGPQGWTSPTGPQGTP